MMQTNLQFAGSLYAGYDLKYDYADNSQQIRNIADSSYRRTDNDSIAPVIVKRNYGYDANGNLTYIATGKQLNGDSTALQATGIRKLLWDEENRLLAINDNGFVSNYWYDANGERAVKMSAENEGVFVNGVQAVGKTGNAKFTAYISPYMVVNSGGWYSKHIYMGSQRIASKLGNSGMFTDCNPLTDTTAYEKNYAPKLDSLTSGIKTRYALLGAEYQGTPSIAGLITQSLPLGAGGLYFYHSDHLGSSSVITDQLGSLVQHVEYVPFGEIFVEERASASSWQTPYLFNAKELDDETGLYYYGARYYDPRASVWLSVDPLAETYPNISSYVYCVNNPVNYVDPDGEEPTLSAYNNASKSTGIPLASMRAVYLTETGGNAYYSDGKLKILFERHYFHKATNGKFDKSNPDLSNKIPGGYGKYSQQHNKLERAKMLDEEAAYSSTSFTGFQIMGANYENTGDYKSAKEFGEAMIKGCEDDHLNAFVMFVKSNPKLLEALKKGDWGEFARLYNGPKYKENNYDTKMKNNYEKLKDNPTEGLDTSNSNQTSTNKH